MPPSHNVEGLKNKMESSVNRMIRKYQGNEDDYVEELRRTHSIDSKDKFDAYIAKIRQENQETIRALNAGSPAESKQDDDVELKKLGMTERQKIILSGPITMEWERCVFPVAIAKKYLDKLTDIFQFPIKIGDYDFEDWTFYRTDPDMDEDAIASATSHEREAGLRLTISEYEEFKQIGFPESILHKVYPPVTGKNATSW